MAQSNGGLAAGSFGRRRSACRCGVLVAALMVLLGLAGGCSNWGLRQDREPYARPFQRNAQEQPAFWRSWFSEPEPPPPPRSTGEFMRLRRLDP